MNRTQSEQSAQKQKCRPQRSGTGLLHIQNTAVFDQVVDAGQHGNRGDKNGTNKENNFEQAAANAYTGQEQGGADPHHGG